MVEGLSKKEKGLTGMDNSGDCWGEGSIRGPNGNGKHIIKILYMCKPSQCIITGRRGSNLELQALPQEAQFQVLSTPLTLASPQKNGYREEAYARPGNRVLGRNSRVPVPTLWTKEDERALPVQSPWPHRLLPVGSGAAGGR